MIIVFNGDEQEPPMPTNLETTKKFYELVNQGDISTIVRDIVDTTCNWTTPAGNFKGRQEITDLLHSSR